MKIGYIRVSTPDQNIERQLNDYKVDKIFIDKSSASTKKRQSLKELINFVRQGDSVHVWSIDRLARNVKDLQEIVEALNSNGASVHFIKENLVFDGNDNPQTKLFLNLMGSVAEFERTIMLERQREGIAIAKKAGKFKGTKPKFNNDEIKDIIKRYQEGQTVRTIARYYATTRASIYNYLRRRHVPVDRKYPLDAEKCAVEQN